MTVRLAAAHEIGPLDRGFATGLLVELASALQRVRAGQLVAFTVVSPVDEDLERWSRFTGNAVVGVTREPDGWRYVVRSGPAGVENGAPLGSRLWLYTNFDCNLACDYCCVRSSPSAARRELGLERVRRIARDARALGVREMFVTGGEPFLLEDIGAVVAACASVARTTVLTNGMLFTGRRREALEQMPRDEVVLQVSLDSPGPELHDRRRGEGTWARAMRGISIAQELGFRVRIAATVSAEEEERTLHAHFDREGIAPDDRVVRRVAQRGFATEGVALARADLWPEPAITAEGVYWHPVGATDDDFFVCAEPLPLAHTIDRIRLLWEEERRFAQTLASVFHCA
jgi:pyruvate-formate lyase-activating enzyme